MSKQSNQTKNAVGFESKEVQLTEAEIKNNEHIREGQGAFGGTLEEPTQSSQGERKDPE